MTTPDSVTPGLAAVDNPEHIALYKTERAAKPFAILPLWQLAQTLDMLSSETARIREIPRET